MQVHVLAVFTVALLIAVATPGPGILAVVSCSLGRGFREAVAMVCGMVVGDLIYFSLAVLGMAALAHSTGEFFLVVKIVGGAYLIWLGLKLWRTQSEIKIDGLAAGSGNGFRRNLIAGLTVTLSNPKTIAFYAGLLPTVIDLSRLSLTDALTMGMIVIVVVGSIPTLYAVAAARARRFFSASRRMKQMNRAAGTMMIGVGVAVVSQ
jgi:threonine/homoserine/homoserine lactone efflux protein